MKTRLVYAITCCVLLALLVIANLKVDRLEEQSQLWQDAHTSLAQYWLEREVAWESERTQWQDATTSRDEIISWWENQPPKIVTIVETQEVVKEVPVKVLETVIQKAPVEIRQYDTIEQFLDTYRGGITYLRSGICLPVAEHIQQSVVEQGYAVSLAFALNHYYYGKYVTGASSGHAGILVGTTDGNYYFVDPNDWKVTKLW